MEYLPFCLRPCWRRKTHQARQCAIEQFSKQKSDSALLCWKCYSDDNTEENQRNVIRNVRTFMGRPITTQNASTKERVNLTFINEHCSRLSILLNMGHTNLSTGKRNILSLLGSCSKGHFYSRHSRSILTISSTFICFIKIFVGAYTEVSKAKWAYVCVSFEFQQLKNREKIRQQMKLISSFGFESRICRIICSLTTR